MAKKKAQYALITPVVVTTIPKTAPWRVKGDGIAYTTSREILNSQEGRRHILSIADIKLTTETSSG